MWFKVEAADEGFLAGAKGRFFHDFVVPAAPHVVFGKIVASQAMGEWLPDFKGATWLGNGAGGLGELREVRLKTIAVRERVTAWEPGRRFAFAIEAASVPILKRMVEDFRLEAVDGGTRVAWTIAWEPRWFARPLVPVLAPKFRKMFAKAAANLGRA